MASAADDKNLTSPQEKMKACNTQAADKKGDERKAFMSSCEGWSAGSTHDPTGEDEGL